MTTLELRRYAEAINKTFGDNAVVSLKDEEDRDFCRSLGFVAQTVGDGKQPAIVEIATVEMECVDLDVAARVKMYKESKEKN